MDGPISARITQAKTALGEGLRHLGRMPTEFGREIAAAALGTFSGNINAAICPARIRTKCLARNVAPQPDAGH